MSRLIFLWLMTEGLLTSAMDSAFANPASRSSHRAYLSVLRGALPSFDIVGVNIDSWIELADKAAIHRGRTMADEEIQIPPDGTVAAEAGPAAPKKASRAKNARAEKPRADSSKQAKPRTRRLSDQEKLERIGQIEAQIAGGATLKDAVKIAGISDETYYQWKKAASQPVTQASVASASVDDELAEFIQLEEENRRLRKLLAEKLRAENADLRKRLGMS